MKYFRLLLSIACLLALTSCTMWDAQKGTFTTMGDSTQFKASYKDGKLTHIEWASNLHTPVTRAHYHGLAALGAEAVMAGIGGGPAVAAGAVIPPLVSRPTSRVAKP